MRQGAHLTIVCFTCSPVSFFFLKFFFFRFPPRVFFSSFYRTTVLFHLINDFHFLSKLIRHLVENLVVDQNKRWEEIKGEKKGQQLVLGYK